MTKDMIRSFMKQERNNLTEQQQVALSSAIHRKLFDLDEYINCGILFSYISFQTEVDTKKILEQAFKDKKRVFVPRVEGKVINFYEILNMNKLKVSSYGIFEPDVEDSKRKSYQGHGDMKNCRKLMLLPGLAFDLYGNRIGYGAGYYDRYLREYQQEGFVKIALAYDFQIVDKLIPEIYDMKADIIITPSRVIQCKEDLII
ncbi:5-formyltetrahydrofolate cyclo-ligase [Mobilitalea sibirica]|uniref:5-formyltetrahydrofolate cyclo-ligase n=1 Tax=Mobilitalea sibirica TaxID=1462919 RepID=A0A8J7HAF4_9FIRM|nr:5-formyltetrahydrofolate cyclo-ligase [Mobilitalea sibirica]MBH1941465.1 5-formyltetrahydrofolate cyclo-ligase [Mobilitalea sibirica]